MNTLAEKNSLIDYSLKASYYEYFPLMKKTAWARPIDIDRDSHIIHHWMHEPHVAPYWNMNWSEENIRQYLTEALARPGFDPYIAFIDETPISYFELYHPHSDPVGKTYNVEKGDLGVHVLIGDEKYQRRYIIRLSTMMMRLIFSLHPETRRVIGEPDVNNKQIHSVMKFLGFSWISNIELPDKIGALHSLRKEHFEKTHRLVSKQAQG